MVCLFEDDSCSKCVRMWLVCTKVFCLCNKKAGIGAFDVSDALN